jgi:16S rRNA (uracil1498-N3)-methyltransferase
MADRFYVNCQLQPGPVLLQGPEAHHLGTVCRLRPGDLVCLFNGDGREYPARISSLDRRGAALEVLAVETPQRELGFRLEAAVPLPKGDRAQFLIEKLTELGVTHFVPLQTARSVVHPRETKLEKLQRHVIEASKQCGRNRLLEVGPLTSWAEYSRGPGLPPLRVMGDPAGGPVTTPRGLDVVFAVGPEGGFTVEEVEMGRAAGWQPVSLGSRILRVETAATSLAVQLGR